MTTRKYSPYKKRVKPYPILDDEPAAASSGGDLGLIKGTNVALGDCYLGVTDADALESMQECWNAER